uniref:CA domain-containing protein n=1 Tax=Rhabditophanes sp. KR3021 TaxID=114890 RepID=A0AC35U6B9_9BILA
MTNLAFYFSILIGINLTILNYAAHHSHHARIPVLNTNGAEQYYGSIDQNQRKVIMVPQISIVPESGPICSYEMLLEKGSNASEIPFQIKVVESALGYVEISLKEKYELVCSQKEFNLRLVAVRCGPELARSEPVPVKIVVKKINIYDPEFTQSWFAYDVFEGKVNTEIARLTASDKDCEYPANSICKYEISNQFLAGAFGIDSQGVLSNSRPLNYDERKSHILTINAYDCGGRKSKSTLVTVNVVRTCVDEITNIPSLVLAKDKKTPSFIASVADVITCSKTEEKCHAAFVTAKITLEFPPFSQCNVNKPLPENSIKRCHLKTQNVNLLPRPKMILKEVTIFDDKGKAKEIIKKSDNGKVGSIDGTQITNYPAAVITGNEEEKYVFDGKTNAVIVPKSDIKDIVPTRFFLTFSMKHDKGTKEEQQAKQNILCESDDSGMNRHHFAVYIRHCKLEVLFRRESKGSKNEFKSAEWRWKLPEVCDGNWHSYNIQFENLENITLFVDGKVFKSNENNLEILDDWPLHKTTSSTTRMVVGACWHGRVGEMTQFFNGELSSMYLLPGDTESEKVVECLHECDESLDYDRVEPFPLPHRITSPKAGVVTLNCSTVDDVVDLMARVIYSHKGTHIPNDKRNISVEMEMSCKEGHIVHFVPANMQILFEGEQQNIIKASPILSSLENNDIVISTAAPKQTTIQQSSTSPLSTHILTISGKSTVTVKQNDLKNGVAMLPDIEIAVVDSIAGTDLTESTKLDWCKVHLNPSRDLDLEYFSSPAALIANMNIDFEHDKHGILLNGPEKTTGYTDIIKKINYFNTRPESYNKRIYSIKCSMNDGKILSNEFIVTMEIINDNQATDFDKLPILPLKPFDAAFNDLTDDSPVLQIDDDFEKHFEPGYDQMGSNRLQNILEMDLPRPKALLGHHEYNMAQGAIAGGAVAVVVVVCVGFLLVLLVVGVLKMRDNTIPRRRRNMKGSGGPETGMEWDDDGMNITVNPLEDVEKDQEDITFNDENSSDCESIYSYREEDDASEEEDEDEEMEPALPLAPNGRPESAGGVRRQYIGGPLGVPAGVIASPVAVPIAPPVVVAPVGQCPGGPSLPIECDPKRPWPQCPPQSYCYATNSVDIGPYFCCPVWSTYGAAWRPAAPFYNYVPPMPANWPDVTKLTAAWPASAVSLPVGVAPIRKAKKQANANLNDDVQSPRKESTIEKSMNMWLERQAKN